MAETDSFLDIGNFVPDATPSSTIDMQTVSPASRGDVIRSTREGKADTIRQAKIAKAMTLGSDEFLRTVATAVEEENRLAQEPVVADWRTMNRLQLKDTYGPEAVAARQRYFEQRDQIRTDKDTDQTWGDIGRAAAGLIPNLAGSTLNLAAVVGEEFQLRGRQGINLLAGSEVLPETRNVPGTDTPASVAISSAMNDFNKYLDSFDSEATQRNEAQMALEQELDAADNDVTYDEAIEAGVPELAARAQHAARTVRDTVANVADNPTSAERLAIEGAAMLVPVAAVSRGSGYALAIKELVTNKKMSKEAAEAFLKTDVGKDFIKLKAADSIPAISGVIGGGSASTQAQQDSLGLTDAELKAHPDYTEMSESGMSHDDMRKQIAGNAALPALGIGAGIGALTGFIAPKFEVDPLAAARGNGTLGSTAASAVISTGKETVEEFIQGGGEQLGANVGINLAGVDRDITEGLVESATLEGLGGTMVSGGIKAPGAVLGTIKETGSLAVSGAKKVADAQGARSARKDDEASPVGSKVQFEQAETARTAATSLIQTTPEQSEAEQTIARNIEAAAFLAPEEAEQMSQFSETLQKVYQDTGKLDRHTVINELAGVLMSKETPENDKIGLSMGILEAYEQSQINDSDEINAAIESLPADSPKRAELQQVWDAAGILGQSKVIAEARAQVESLTPEMVSGMLDVESVLKGDTSTPEAQNTIKAMELIGRYNPSAIDLEKYDLVLNQVNKAAKKNPMLAKSLATTRSIVAEMQAADARKAEIEAGQDALVEGLTEEQKKQGHGKYHARTEVTKDVLERGNSYTDGKSLLKHRQEFETARMSGKMEDAKAALQELGNFARSQINKIMAYNQSAEAGTGRAGRLSFQAYNPKLGVFFAQDENKVWVDPASSESVAVTMDAHVDTSMLVNLYNTLATNYADQVGEMAPLQLPDLHPKIKFTKPADVVPVQKTAPVVKAVTEPTQTTPQQTEPVKAKTLSESLPNLVTDADGRNQFVESFDRNPNGAKTLDMEKPAQEVSNTIDAIAADEANQVKPVSTEQRKTLSDVVQTHIPNLIQSFRDRLAPRKADLNETELKLSKKVQRWLGELDQEGKKTLTYKDALPLNFLTIEEDGSSQLEPRVMDALGMATVETMVELSQRTVPTMDNEEIRDRLNLAPDTTVTEEMRRVVRSGIHIQNVIDTIERKTQRLLGVTPKQTKEQNLTQGLFRAMAANMLEIMEESGWLQVDPGYYKVEGEKGPRQHPVITDGNNLDAMDIRKGLAGQPDIFSRALVPDNEITRYIDKPPSRVAETQKNNRFADTSEAEQKAMDRLQRTPFKFNMPLVDHWMGLGKDTIFSLFGGKEVDPKTTNKIHAESIKGRNASIRSGWDGVMGYYTDALQSIGQGPIKPEVSKLSSAQAAEIMKAKDTENNYVPMTEEQEADLRNTIETIDDATGLNFSGLIKGMARRVSRGYAGYAQWEEGILSLSSTVLDNIYDRKAAMRVLMHELGHLFDAANGDLQSRTDQRLSSKENGDLYQEIINLVKKDAAWKKHFAYALDFQRDEEKTSELFAELFAFVMMNPEKAKEDLPNGTRYIQELVEGRDAAIPNLSDRDALRRVSGRATAARDGEQSQSLVGADKSQAQTVGDVSLFFAWFVSSTGRLFQSGPVTPQANKIARALMTATNSTLDLTTERDQKRLWLGVAQALDISIDRKNHAEAIAEARELVKAVEGYGPVVSIMEGHLRGEPITDENRADLIDFMQNAYDAEGNKMESTPVAFHALMTVARANLAQRDGTANEFKTALSLEADGITDGPINAMVHMMTGAFDVLGEQVKILAKGGWYFSDEKMSRNDYIAQDNEDLYHKAAEILRQNLMEVLGNKANARVLRLLNTLEAFSDDFGMTENKETGSIDVEIGRNITKNPLTTFLYGAGVEGITQKIVDGILGQFYELMTEVAQQTADGTISSWRDHPKFAGNMQLVEDMADALGMSQKALEHLMDDPVNAEIPAAAQRNLLGGLQNNFGDPLVEAIDEATGGLQAAMQLTQKASNMQAIIFQDVFARLAEEKKTELGLSKDQILSQNDMSEVFREAMKVAPIYETDAQSFHISGREGYDSEQRIASSLYGRTSSGATVPRAGKAGVKVSPYMTIGTGDGRMILNIYVDADGALSTSLPVFDGVELALDQIEDGSRQVNEGVFKGWTQGNIYRTMQESMDATLLNFDMNSLSEAAQKQLNTLLKGSLDPITGEPMENPEFTRETLEAMRDQLRQMANENQARKEAMASLKSWVDHMAGADSPSEHDGEAIIHDGKYDVEKISQRLNEIYHEKLAQIKANQTASNDAPATQKPDATIQSMLDIVGEDVPGHEGVKKLSGQKIYAFIREQTGFSKDQNKLFWEILAKDPAIAQGQFFFGSPKALEAMRNDILPKMPKEPLEAGQHWVAGNVSLITNVTPETMLHEMLHAHTAKTLMDHYANPEASSPHVKDAVARLEGLMADFQALNAQSESKGTQEAVSLLKTELAGLSGNPAAQLSEFISWTLSNQNLINLTKRSKTYSPLQKIGRKTLHLLKRMLGITTEARSDLFSKIRFNTEILGAEPVREGKTKAETDYILNQAYGPDPRTSEIEARFTDRLNERLQSQRDPNDLDQRNDLNRHVDRVDRLQQGATKAVEMVHAQGFFMNPRQREAFKAVHMAMMSGMQMNPAALRQANRAYRHAIRTLKVEDFQENPGNVSAREDTLANMQFDLVTGKAGLQQSADGRTDLLATFMALTLVSPTMREVTDKLAPPKDVEGFNGTFDGFLEGVANTTINSLTRASISPRNMGKTMTEQLDVLADALSRSQGERRIMATERKLMQPVEWANTKTSGALGSASEKVSNYFVEKAKASKGKTGAIGYTAAAIVTALGSKEASTARGEAFSEMLNASNGFHETRALLGDLRGMSGANAPLMRMINRVKSQIDAMRQNYRDTIPAELAAKFSRKITRQEWSRLHQGIGQTDFPALEIQDAMRLAANPDDAKFYINAEMERIKAIDPKNAALYQRKANELATWMTKREVVTDNLLRNADAIAWLISERTKGPADPTPELVTAIDKLVSLMAYEKLDAPTKETIKSLAETEGEGLRTLITYQGTTKRIEDLKAPTMGPEMDVAKLNRWKGYIPATTAPGSATVVEDDSKEAEMARKGYVRVGTYHGDGTERYRGRRGIYTTSVGGKNTFRQGVAQTVHETYQGIDVRTGKSQTGDTAGMIYGKAAKGITARRTVANKTLPAGEYLMPLYGPEGKIMGYERPLPAKTIQTMNRDTNLSRMLGVWSGRVLEERASNKFNQEFVQTMKDIRDKEYKDKGKSRADREFVNIADLNIKDPVIKDAWDTMGWRIKADAAEIFGRENYFPIRKDMIKDAIGYRAASVTDPFTGVTRLSEPAQKAIAGMLSTVMGERNAFRWLKKGENVLQTGVSYAKETIIIRSVVVPFGNIVSNMLHLAIHGVNPIKMATGMRDKFLEVQQYVKNQEEILRLNIELSADPDNRRLQRELASIEDVNKNLSIAPLIEAGEFSTISENLTAEDTAIREGGLADWVEAAVNKLPGSARTVGKNLVITKDTALYRGLNRSVQYGDFIAKAVLYDHLTEKGVAHEKIMDTLAEEFVNYNRLSGRGRDFLESMGMLWFFNYKLRIQKVLLNTARERPASFVLMAGGVGPAMDIDTVLSGSGVGAWWDDRLGFAVSPEMGLNAASLNPWWQMTQ